MVRSDGGRVAPLGAVGVAAILATDLPFRCHSNHPRRGLWPREGFSKPSPPPYRRSGACRTEFSRSRKQKLWQEVLMKWITREKSKSTE